MPLESVCANPETTIASDTRFVGKTLVITGAGGQFGRTGCLYFARRGARIAALDLRGLQETFDELKKELSDFDFCAYECDITNADQVKTTVDSIASRFNNKIDYLWNNAGYQGEIKPLLDYDPQDFKRTMEINVTGMFIVLQAVARKMSKQTTTGYFSIVNTGSVAGMRGTPAMPAYTSSKAATLALTSTASKDLAPYKIRVNCVSPALIGPGYMWDRQNELHAQCESPYFANDPETVATNKINSVPLKRLGSVEEVVKVVAFLLSDDSSYMTGSNLVVDGGMISGLKA